MYNVYDQKNVLNILNLATKNPLWSTWGKIVQNQSARSRLKAKRVLKSAVPRTLGGTFTLREPGFRGGERRLKAKVIFMYVFFVVFQIF